MKVWKVWALILCLCASCYADEFKKVAFIDPFQILIEQTDTSGIQPESYYNQYCGWRTSPCANIHSPADEDVRQPQNQLSKSKAGETAIYLHANN